LLSGLEKRPPVAVPLNGPPVPLVETLKRPPPVPNKLPAPPKMPPVEALDPDVPAENKPPVDADELPKRDGVAAGAGAGAEMGLF